MYLASFTLCGALVVLLVLFIALALQFTWNTKRKLSLTLGEERPKVCVLLPLRGSDPFLHRCLTALTKQDYSDYAVYVIVDNPEDPAREVVEQVLAETQSQKLHLQYLEVNSSTCSLRSAALVQVLDSLPSDWEVIVQVDADSYPYPNWLQDLLAGLTAPEVGIACGFRWFSPQRPTLANLTRHVWNTAAVTQMLPTKIGWGGSLAFKREAFEKANVRSLWEKALFDDSVTTSAILDAGYKLEVTPHVCMINEEDTNWRGVVVFIHRQLLNIRLYHNAFIPVSILSMIAALIHFAAAAFLVVAFATGHHREGLYVLATFSIYVLIQAMGIWLGELKIARRQSKSNRPYPRLSPLILPIAVVCTFVVFPYCVIKSLMTKDVTWRGITYKILSPFNVQRLNYEPFKIAPEDADKSL